METQTDIMNKMQERLAQSSALLNVVYGGGIDNFDECSLTVKDNYLWACASLVDEALELSKEIKLAKD